MNHNKLEPGNEKGRLVILFFYFQQLVNANVQDTSHADVPPLALMPPCLVHPATIRYWSSATTRVVRRSPVCGRTPPRPRTAQEGGPRVPL